jgi:hypothetical protein
MMSKIKILVAAMVVVGSASTAFAASLPQQDRDAWFVDSGRYINGQTPSEPYYGDHPQAQFEDHNRTFSTGRDAQDFGN